MQDSGFQEKRNAYRFLVANPLTYFRSPSSDSNNAQSRDISTKGLGLVVKEEIAPKTTLDILIDMPESNEKIHIKAEVIWSNKIESNKYRIGVCLRDSGSKLRQLILRTIQAKL